jgi:hypothetical protein
MACMDCELCPELCAVEHAHCMQTKRIQPRMPIISVQLACLGSCMLAPSGAWGLVMDPVGHEGFRRRGRGPQPRQPHPPQELQPEGRGLPRVRSRPQVQQRQQASRDHNDPGCSDVDASQSSVPRHTCQQQVYLYCCSKSHCRVCSERPWTRTSCASLPADSGFYSGILDLEDHTKLELQWL